MNLPKEINSSSYKKFLQEIKNRITSAKIQASKSLNKELIKLYWDLGKTIVERQKQYSWGHSIVEKLSEDINKESSNIEGFSANNLWRMRIFYLSYENNPKLAQLVQEIPWGQNIVIFQMVKKALAREYYIKSCIQMGWSRNVLLNQIKANAYEVQLKNPKQHNFSKALPVHLTEQADESLKSIYNLDFLGITKPFLERELEKRLIEKLKLFILELGYGFTFMGNQYRLTLGNNEYFIDLLFFNRRLKCLVAIELKTGKFEPEYAGKMDFYLNLLNDNVRLKDENPSIGIILCAEKDNIVVEYALKNVKNPVGVAKYHLTSKLPDKLKGILPGEKELKQQLKEEI